MNLEIFLEINQYYKLHSHFKNIGSIIEKVVFVM